MKRKFRRLELWSDLECRGGDRLAVARHVLALKASYRLVGEEQLTATVPVTDGLVGQFLQRRVLRVVFADNGYEEWRLTADAKERDTDKGKLFDMTAASARQDLADDTIVRRRETTGEIRHDFEAPSLTPTQQVQFFILQSLVDESLTHYGIGVIEPTAQVDMVYAGDSCLAALLRLADAASTAEGRSVEFRLRRNGTTQYLIDLLFEIGADADRIEFRPGKNLKGVRVETDTAEFGNIVFPRGTVVEEVAATCAHNTWDIASLAGTVVELVDPAGGPGPIIEDDQLNGFALYKPCNATLYPITDSVLSGQTVTVSSATGLAVGDRVEIRRNASNDFLTFVPLPSAINPPNGYGRKVRTLERPDLPETINLVKNPAMRDWGTRADDEPPPHWCIVCSDGSSECSFPSDFAAAPLRGYGEGYGESYGELFG